MAYGKAEQQRLNQMAIDRRAAQTNANNERKNTLLQLLEQRPNYQFAYRSPEFTKLRTTLREGGPLEQYEQARELLRLKAAANLDRQTSDLAGQSATAYSQLAMGGGLSSGARERVAQGGLESNLFNRQRLRGETQSQYTDIAGKEAADKLEAQKQIADIMAAERKRKQQMEMDAWKQRTETLASLEKADAQRAAAANSCFGKGTMIEMEDGSKKAIESVKIGDRVKDGGDVYVTQLASYDSDAYVYEGTIVTGQHAVFEDGVWTRVKDSKRAVKFDGRVNVVYNIATENHIIWVDGVLFADLHETDAYEFISDEESIIRLNQVEVPGFEQSGQAVC